MPSYKCHHGFSTRPPWPVQALIQQLELPSEALPLSFATHHEAAAATATDVVGQPREAERLGTTEPISMTIPGRLRTETQYSRLAGLDIQAKGR
jgi:hypothetical protein